MFEPASRYLAAVTRRGGKDIPLSETRAELKSDEWYDIAAGKGVLILAELRRSMGDHAFLAFMNEFGRAHAGRAVTTAGFLAAAEKAHGKTLEPMKEGWLNGNALAELGADVQARKASGRFWSVDAFERQLDSTLIIHGTLAEADAQREAAVMLQRKLAGRWANITVPIKADRDVTDNDLKTNHILLIGRPATNRITARLADAFPVHFGPASFKLRDQAYAHPRTAIVAAGPNPLAVAKDRSVVVCAGMSAEGTWQGIRRFPDSGRVACEVLLMEDGAPIRPLTITPATTAGIAVTPSVPPSDNRPGPAQKSL
jgi:hypothetical protein